MIRILQVVNKMDMAGLETVLMNYYRNIDRNDVQFDFLTHREDDGVYDKEIKHLGGRVYHAPRITPQNYIKYFRWMKNFFENHEEYMIIHSHIDTMSFFPLLAAKISGIQIRIAHSHSTAIPVDYKFPIKLIAKYGLKFVTTYNFSCGKCAGNFLFGKKKFEVINNAIDFDKYRFNEYIRFKKREELKINRNEFIIGHVGRFDKVKNHNFIIDMFYELSKENKKYYLLLIGSGKLKGDIIKKIINYSLEDRILILENRSDINELLQAMDLFILPSLYEGFPTVALEAQVSGLKCILSETITREVAMSNQCIYLPLNSMKTWIEKIRQTNSNYKRENNVKNEYDIKIASKKLVVTYKNKLKEIKVVK